MEIAVAALIIGLMAGFALPAIRRAQQNTRASVLFNDFRTFATAFQQYHAAVGKWPSEQSTSTKFPAGMNTYLGATAWGRPTVIGGKYNWDTNVKHNGLRRTAVIAIYASTALPLKVTTAELLAYDRKFDDGNLTTGIFQIGYLNSPIFIIEN